MEAGARAGEGLGKGVRDYSLPFLSAFDPKRTFPGDIAFSYSDLAIELSSGCTLAMK
jgi:hypothetical protein